MSKYLFKLGRWAVNHKNRVMGGAIVTLLIVALLALIVGPAFNEEISIPNTESATAGEILEKEFSNKDEASPGAINLVFKAPKGETLESDTVNEKITELLDEVKKDKKIISVASPLELGNLSEDKTIGYAVVSFNSPPEEVSEKSKAKIIQKIAITNNAGIQTELAGNVTFSELEIGGVTEVIGVVIAFLVLAITFTSFLAAGMPILTSAIGLGIGLLLVIIGTNYFDIPSFSMSLAAMLGLAVGIDYSLFIISRFRQELAAGHNVEDAAAIANGTAGSAVLFAGVTVIIALLGLAVAQIPFLTMMGLTAAVCVLLAILVAIILVPAILGIMGHKIGPNRKNTFLKKLTSRKNKSNTWWDIVTKRPLIVTIIGIVLLLVLSTPFFHMELGLPDNGTKSEDTIERRAYDLLSEGYGPGYHASLIVLLKAEDLKNEEELLVVSKEIEKIDNVKYISPPIPSPNKKYYMLSVTPKTGPNDSSTKDLVREIRNIPNNTEISDDVSLKVTGQTAVNIDISEKLNDSLPIFATIIVLFAFILLVIVFRSILVPLKAVLGFLLSLGATLGFVVFVVQDGNLIDLFGFPTASPVLAFLPVIVIGILFGLAMDYEVFLVSRMREEYVHSGDAQKAVLVGIKDSSSVVTAAGLIMISVFTGFMLAPDPIIKSMGFALTFGIIFDAFVVRLTIVPAVMILMGKSAWYLPKSLDKIIPNIDIEGTTLIEEINKNRDKTI
ncbi:MMPL family transporter [Lysinibacillus capsici]|uniref:MMPL family transporter n=1 Tax=Lysinibacillus capsici TaxID=2115968 RepID=A0ABY8KTN5_9BACI|nr:MMPL family transporter [Lysinibacillus capsici]MDP1395150.1 MMPL family transporter [Lysinibacillus capsici]MDP1415351.1 MMPL family transporter [Lysinibacillus capsici]MDP1431513.1 MMPL family transporter [Lysinibacillus capsici]WGF41070.1 MMPL family transporter [Lysinibacillus capsici]